MDARSPVFDRARASGLRVADWQNLIMVNMLGQRFYDETGEHRAPGWTRRCTPRWTISMDFIRSLSERNSASVCCAIRSPASPR